MYGSVHNCLVFVCLCTWIVLYLDVVFPCVGSNMLSTMLYRGRHIVIHVFLNANWVLLWMGRAAHLCMVPKQAKLGNQSLCNPSFVLRIISTLPPHLARKWNAAKIVVDIPVDILRIFFSGEPLPVSAAHNSWKHWQHSTQTSAWVTCNYKRTFS